MDVKAMAAMFSFVLTFTDDEVTMMNAGPHGEMTHTNDYEVVKAAGDVLTLKSVDDEGQEETVIVTFAGRDEIAVDTGEEDAPVMRFSRAPAKAETED